MSNYNSLKSKVAGISNITTKPMFGHQCYLISGKVFAGFNNKNDWQVIVRLPKNEQCIAIKTKGIKPFSHGAKAGWAEIDMKQVTTNEALKWIKKGHEYAEILATK